MDFLFYLCFDTDSSSFIHYHRQLVYGSLSVHDVAYCQLNNQLGAIREAKTLHRAFQLRV